MGLKELIAKFKGEPEEEYEPKPVVDRGLDSLRRESQVQDNEVEKEFLKKKIAEYKKDKMRKMLYGIDPDREKDENFLGGVENKKVEVMAKNCDINSQKSLMKQKNLLKSDIHTLKQKSMLKQTNLMKGIGLDNKKKEFKKSKMRFV